MDGLDSLIRASSCLESLQAMATVWLKGATGQHNISSHFLPQFDSKEKSFCLMELVRKMLNNLISFLC